MIWEVEIIISSFKLLDFFFVNKQITLITIVMCTQRQFCLCLAKTNTKLFSAALILPLISTVGPSPNTKNLFLQL